MNKLISTTLLALSLSTPMMAGCANKGGGGGGGARPPLETDDQKTLYALGLSIGRSLSVFNLTPQELSYVEEGLSDMTQGQKPQVPLETWGPKIGELARKRANAGAEKEKDKSKAFIDQAAKEPGAEKTASGMVFKSEKEGTGESPKPTDRVKVNYEGKLTDGTIFDSSYKRNQPAEFPLGGVIPCWTEGLQKMKVGGKAKLVCPSSIAYGDQGRPPQIPGGATLVFEVELLSIDHNAQPSMPQMPMNPHGSMPGLGGHALTPPHPVSPSPTH